MHARIKVTAYLQTFLNFCIGRTHALRLGRCLAGAPVGLVLRSRSVLPALRSPYRQLTHCYPQQKSPAQGEAQRISYKMEFDYLLFTYCGAVSACRNASKSRISCLVKRSG